MAEVLHIDTTKGPFFRGIGDSILLSWIAEGAKGSDLELSLHANGVKRDVLEMLGTRMHPEPIGVSLSDVPIFDSLDGGAKPRHERIMQILGLKTVAKRPEVRLPCWAKHHGGQFWDDADGARRVLLCPEVSDLSREWPHWDRLAEMLTAQDDCVKMLRADRHLHYGLAAGVIAAADVVVALDSSHAHMAATLGKKTVVLLGPTMPNVFAHAENVRCLSVTADVQHCVGCCFNYYRFTRSCRVMGCAAMMLLPVSDVLKAIDA